MKMVLVPILMLLFIIQSFSSTVLLIDFSINQAYISRKLCVNKTRPAMHCNGKCQLTRKLKEGDNNMPADNSRIKIGLQEVTDKCESPGSLSENNTPQKLLFIQRNSFLPDSRFPSSIFRPPAINDFSV